MAIHDVACRLCARITDDNDEVRYVNMSELPNISQEVRAQWIDKISKHLKSESSREAIRPLNFVFDLDGSVKSPPVLDVKGESGGMYPAHYRIPPTSIDSMERPQQIMRQECFAFASLVYEIWLLKKPFERLACEEVQRCYSNAEFPEDVRALPPYYFITVLSNWSVDFANISMPRPSNILERVLNIAVKPGIPMKVRSYIRAHPYLFGLQVTGAVVGTAAAATPAILGAVGFSALGPVAGSAAAGLQGSLGAVQAGSAFAWCQSAAMGGAAVNGIIATGATGGGVAALATAGAVGQGEDMKAMEEKFQAVYRKGRVHFH